MLLLFAMWTMALGVSAQRHKTIHSLRGNVDTLAFVKAYSDSLHSLRMRIDTTDVSLSLEDADLMYRLFVPPTFYHSVIKGRFAIYPSDFLGGTAKELVDSAMMNVYMTRPDLVTLSEKRLKAAGSIRKDLEQTVKPDVEMVDKIDLLPEENTDNVPVGVVIQKPNFWSFSGDNYLQFLQNYISDNWYKGGESNYSMVGSVTLNANYNSMRGLKFDNKLEMKLGFQTSKSDTLHKFKTNNDMIRYTGVIGLQAFNRWYYTLQLLAYTQFTQGLKSNDKKVYSDFMSPFNLNIGLGMEYSVKAIGNRLTGTVNIAPLSFNFRYVDRKNLAGNYGISGDHQTLEDFGSQVTSSLTWNISNQVSWKSRVYFYTTYKRTEIEWENTISLAISKFINANIFLYPRFDDSDDKDTDLGYFQFKEYSSLGFSYSF